VTCVFVVVLSAYICKVKRCDQQPQRNRKRPSHVKKTYGYSGVHVTRSLVFVYYFVDRCLPLCPFSFGHCVVCPSIYRFWLPPFGIFKLFLCL